MLEFITNIDGHLAMVYFSYAMFNFLLSGFFGGSETIFLSLNKIILYAKQSKGQISAKILIYLIERSSQFLIGIVILNNVTLILSVLFISKMFIEAWHIPLFWAPVLTTLFMTPCTLIFAEVLPKSIGHPFADVLAYRFAFIWLILYVIVYPIAFIFRQITVIVSFLAGINEKIDMSMHEFQGLLDISLKSGALNTGEREFINNILEFREIQANEAMTPLSQIVCIEKKQSVYQALQIMQEHKVSILPVYDSRIDEPIGRIRAKDLITAKSHEKVSKYIQEAFFVPETAYLEKVLMQMQKQNMPLAFVADEYGGVVGVLRVEDIVSEIVGEVIEEGEIEFQTLSDGNIVANGLCDIDDLFESLKCDIQKIDSKTLSGYIMEELGHMPKVGDIVFCKPWYFEVLSLKGRRVNEVFISRSMKKNNENKKVN